MKREEVILDRLHDAFKPVPFVPVSFLPDSFSSIPFWVYSPFLFWFPEKQKEVMRTFMGRPRLSKAALRMGKLMAVYFDELIEATKGDKKIIMHPVNHPPDIFHAFENAVSMCTEYMANVASIVLDGCPEYYLDLAQELGLPESLCSGSVITGAAVLADLAPKPDAVITSGVGSCDPSTKLHELVAERCNVPFMGVEESYVRDEWGLEYHKKTYRKAVERLEEVIGEEIDTKRLREVIEKGNKATELYVEMMDLKRAVPCPVPNLFNLFVHGARFSMWGRDEAIDVMETVVEVSKKRMKNGEGPLPEEKLRSGWIYASIYHNLSGLWNWLEEEKGVSYLLDGATFLPTNTIDTSSRETMIDGLAEHSWNFPMNRQMGGYGEHWIDDIIQMVKDLGIDCLIFSGHLACKNSHGLLRQVTDQIRDELGIPFLKLEVDAWDPRPTSIQSIQQDLSDFFDTVQ